MSNDTMPPPAVSALVDWCKATVPNDLVMPVGDHKAPQYKHAGGRWSWYLLDKHTRRQQYDPGEDVGILLHDLCVVDVDCLAVDLEMRARFPILETTMSERTTKGRHYFFKRSKKADSDGYYDGAGQRIPKVDFKSVCSNGTSGFIVVAPSTGKTWINSFEDISYVPEIPDALLDYVAKPTHTPVSLLMKFAETGEEEYFESSSALTKLAIVHMFVEFTEMTLPMGTKHELLTLLDLVEGAPLVLADVQNKRPFVERLCKLADFLGLKVTDLGAMKTKWMEAVRLYEVHPAMAVALEDPTIVVLTDDLARITMVDDMCLGDNEIFIVDKPLYDKKPLTERVHLVDQIPPLVLQLMMTFPEEIVLAGGMATGCLIKNVETGNDADLFIVGTEERAYDIVAHVLELTEDTARTFRTGNAITFFVDGEDTPIQIILKLHNTAADVIHGFDLEPSKSAIYVKSTGMLTAIATRGWLESARSFSFPVLSSAWSSSSTYRIIKYGAKGFQPYICGLARAEDEYSFDAASKQRARRDLVVSLTACEGVRELLCAERFFQGENLFGPDTPLTPTTMTCMTGLFRGIRRSDYSAHTTWNSRALGCLSRWCLRMVGWRSQASREYVRLTADNSRDLLFWKPATGSRVYNCFYKAEANLDGVVVP